MADPRHDPPLALAASSAPAAARPASTAAAYGTVKSRFVSQDAIGEARARKEQELQEAYARIGQEPPKAPEEEVYDPRTLYERLQANKDAKQEAFDEKMKLSNQFRGIDQEESVFLADVQAQKQREERAKRNEELEELNRFRKAAQRSSPPPPLVQGLAGSPPAASGSAGSASAAAPTASSAAAAKKGKRKREGLLGVVRKKPAPAPAASASSSAAGAVTSGGAAAPKAPAAQAAAASGSQAEGHKKG